MNVSVYLKILRPHQWLKNLMIFFPPFLGGEILGKGVVLKGLIPFIAFACASSTGYIFNDLMDSKADRCHPAKSGRPLATGAITPFFAKIMSALLCTVAFALAFAVSKTLLLIIVAYLTVSVSYSYNLKNIPIVDLFCIAAGFLLRLQAGGEAFEVRISEWLFMSVLLLSLFLSAGKRLSEKLGLDEMAAMHRKSLGSYPEHFLDGVLYMTGGAVLVTYAMYVISRHSSLLLCSVPLCCFGLLRYMLRVQSGKGGDPTESLTRDVPLLIVAVVWVGMVGWGIYGR